MHADGDTGQAVGMEEMARRVGQLTDAAFALAAVADALRQDTPGLLSEEQGRVLAELGMAVRSAEGGWALVPHLAQLPDRIRRGLAQRLAVTLRRAAAAADGRLTWVEQDLALKVDLGRLSGPAATTFVTQLAPRLGDLADRLAAPGTAVLDVGTGVGEIAVAFAEAAPSLRVVGIDVLDDVLDVARRTVAERGLSARISLRHQDVAALSEVEAYDLVYLPAYFVPEHAVVTALPRIHTALRPGGWLVVAAHPAAESPLGRAVWAWRQAGGDACAWDASETVRRLRAAGLQQVHTVVFHPLVPALVVGVRAG
ncbi:SAM-dependent methyltransferase [Geodermatophilus sp. SYSU D00691]